MHPFQRPRRQAPDPHFERLHGPPLSYARSIQSFLQIHDPQPALTIMDSPTDPSRFSHPTVPSMIDFTKEIAPVGNMPPPQTPGLLSGFCEGPCSITNCESGCNPSLLDSGICSLSQCNNLEQCTSEECCKEPECLDHISVPTTRRESFDYSAADQWASSSQHQYTNGSVVFSAYDNLPGFDETNADPVQCHWLLPDQECDITAPTRNALSQHVLNDHIQPKASLTCGWFDCEEQIEAQQFTDHLWNSHHPEQHVHDSYVCLWNGCMEMFSDAEQLETHMEVAHTHIESIDCRWGGCGTTTTNSAELHTHVDKEHLRLHIQPPSFSPNPDTSLSGSHESQQPRHPLYWKEENDELLIRVRAQNLTFPQIASQYVPGKSAQACQRRYTVLYNREQEGAPPSPEQSTPLLTYSPLPPASNATSPYGDQYPPIDPSLSQTSPALLSNHSSRLVSDHPSTQGSHVCMWITDDSTGAICASRFGDSNGLQAHVESSHYPFSDDRRRRPISHWVCKWMGCARRGQSSGTRDKLKKHVYTHTSCKSTLSSENLLSSSYRTVYPFTCRHCGRRLRDSTKLADHERTHTKEKPYECDLCEMAFASQDALCKYKPTFVFPFLLTNTCSDSHPCSHWRKAS